MLTHICNAHDNITMANNRNALKTWFPKQTRSSVPTYTYGVLIYCRVTLQHQNWSLPSWFVSLLVTRCKIHTPSAKYMYLALRCSVLPWSVDTVCYVLRWTAGRSPLCSTLHAKMQFKIFIHGTSRAVARPKRVRLCNSARKTKFTQEKPAMTRNFENAP